MLSTAVLQPLPWSAYLLADPAALRLIPSFPDLFQMKKMLMFEQGTLKGLTSLYLLVRKQLFQDELKFFFHFQNDLILTSKFKEVNHTDTSPFRVPWFEESGLWLKSVDRTRLVLASDELVQYFFFTCFWFFRTSAFRQISLH